MADKGVAGGGAHAAPATSPPSTGNSPLLFLERKIRELMQKVETERRLRCAAEVQVAELSSQLDARAAESPAVAALEVSNKELRSVNAELLGHCDNLQTSLKHISEAYRKLHKEHEAVIAATPSAASTAVGSGAGGGAPAAGPVKPSPDAIELEKDAADLRRELGSTRQQLRATHKRLAAAERQVQLLERDRNAVVSRSASLQQRLDALRNRNSQLKQKVQQLEKRLERHADDAEKLDKLTMELAIVQNRLSHSPRRDSPTRGLQSYMRAHDPDQALQVAALEERNHELEHRLAALSAIHHQMLSSLAPVVPPPARRNNAASAFAATEARAAKVARGPPSRGARNGDARAPRPAATTPPRAPVRQSRSGKPDAHADDSEPRPRDASPVPHGPPRRSPQAGADQQRASASAEAQQAVSPPRRGSSKGTAGDACAAAEPLAVDTRPAAGARKAAPLGRSGRRDGGSDAAFASGTSELPSPLRIRGPAHDVRGIQAFLQRERERMAAQRAQSRPHPQVAAQTGTPRGDSEPHGDPLAHTEPDAHSPMRLSELNDASGADGAGEHQLSPELHRAKERLMASQSSEVFDRAVADTESALQSSFANDADDDAGSASRGDDDDGGPASGGDDNGGGGGTGSVQAPRDSDDTGGSTQLAAAATHAAGERRPPIARVAPLRVTDASPPPGAALTSPLPSARSEALISPAGPTQMWRQASEESDLIRPVRPKYGTLDDF